jgi:hypothetical protein
MFRFSAVLVCALCFCSITTNGTTSGQTSAGPASVSTAGGHQPAAEQASAQPDLTQASSDELMNVYHQLRSLQAGNLSGVAEGVTWKRDAGAFTFKSGRITFAAPVAGNIVAAVFIGEGTFELNPPTTIDQNQISRFTHEPKLVDGFREAVFFFTDGSWQDLQKLVYARSGAPAPEAAKALESVQKRIAAEFNPWWENEHQGRFPIRNLAARMLADLCDPYSRGFFLADIKSEHHNELFYHISWNREQLLWSMAARDEEVSLMHYSGSTYFEWWSGFHVAAEYGSHAHPEHRSLLAHCIDEQITAEIGKDRQLSATATMKFEVTAEAPRVLPLNLEGVLRISAVTDESGAKLAFIQEDRKLDSDPWIILPKAAETGRSYTVKIAYEEDSNRDTRVIFEKGSGLYYVTDRESWYPSFGAFDDRVRFHLKFSSPKKFKFIATGTAARVEQSWRRA